MDVQETKTAKRISSVVMYPLSVLLCAVYWFAWKSPEVHDYLNGLGDAERKCLLGIAVFIGSIFVAWLTDRLISGFVLYWAGRTKSQVDDEIVEALHRPVTRTVILIGLGFLLRVLELKGTVADPITHLLWSVGVLFWAIFAFRLSQILLRAASRETSRYHVVGARSYPLFDNVGKLLIVAGTSYALISIWGVDATGWIASAGILGLAVGFAAKDTLSNLFAGVFILADAPYIVGDFIVLGSGERGQVVDIGIRSTRILTRDDVEITIPNAIMGNSMVVNESRSRASATPTRVKVSVGVAYGSDIDQVREVLMQVALANSVVCKEPEPRVRFRTFAESGLDLQLLCWISDPILKGRTLDALNTAVYKAFAEAAIEIPYPRRDLVIHHEREADEGGSA